MTKQANPVLPAQLTLRSIGLVFVGGSLGVLAREALMRLLPDVAGVPAAVIAANLLGAFLLGALLELLARLGPVTRLREAVRLLFGTGLLGGFTTYSGLALSVTALAGEGAGWVAAASGIVMIVVGAAAGWGGVLLGDLIARGLGQGSGQVSGQRSGGAPGRGDDA